MGKIIIGFAIVLVLFVVSIVFIEIYKNFHKEYNQEFTVKGKENVKFGNGGKYLIYTDKTTYEITDSLLNWRWDSSDVYGNIQVGKTYTATLQGFRSPFMSWYPNILNPTLKNK